MSVKIICPRCGEKYDAAPEYVGRQFLCRCGAVVAVPVPAAEPGVPAEPESAPRPKTRSRLNAYGLLALVFGTLGTAALVAAGALSATAFTTPVSGAAKGDLCAAAFAFGAFATAFALAALFRIADAALRRSGLRCFF